jgi:hypothetical protein
MFETRYEIVGRVSGNRGDDDGGALRGRAVSLRSRITRVKSLLAAVTPENRIWSITLIQAGHDPDRRLAGVYGSSLHRDIVYDGPEQPPLPRERMASHCLVIECCHDPVEPPAREAGDLSEILTKCDTLRTPFTKGSL